MTRSQQTPLYNASSLPSRSTFQRRNIFQHKQNIQTTCSPSFHFQRPRSLKVRPRPSPHNSLTPSSRSQRHRRSRRRRLRRPIRRRRPNHRPAHLPDSHQKPRPHSLRDAPFPRSAPVLYPSPDTPHGGVSAQGEERFRTGCEGDFGGGSQGDGAESGVVEGYGSE